MTVARVPTGMKTGVSIGPREVNSVPRRARESGSRAPVTKRMAAEAEGGADGRAGVSNGSAGG